MRYRLAAPHPDRKRGEATHLRIVEQRWVAQRLQGAPHPRDGGEEFDALLNAHLEHLGDVLSAVLDVERLAADRAVVLRLPLLGLRVAPDEFFAQITAALAGRGGPLALAS